MRNSATISAALFSLLLAGAATVGADVDGAALTLQRWCADHRLASEPRIVAKLLHTTPQLPSAEQRATLRVAATEAVHFRHVQLRCGQLVLAEAENWYVPGRLTPAMNHELETTDAPFGVVVRALNFQRHTLSARLLWSPLPHAVLTLPDGTPFSLLVETYTGNVLAFAAPRSD